MKWIQVLLLAGSIVRSDLLHAESEEGLQDVLVHPFRNREEPTSSFAFSGRSLSPSPTPSLQAMSLRGQAESMFKAWQLHHRILARPRPSLAIPLAAAPTLTYDFAVDGFPLCQFELKAHVNRQGNLALLGRFPKVEVLQHYSLGDWPSDAQLVPHVAEVLSRRGLDSNYRIDHGSRCLWLQESELQPVWVMDIESDGLLYSVVVDHSQVYSFEPKHFHATGSGRIYSNNPSDAALVDFPLREMKPEGYLENAYFTTCVPSAEGGSVCPPDLEKKAAPYAMVNEGNLAFAYDPGNDYSNFAQTSVFTNANRALEWFEEHGFTQFGTNQIRLAVHAVFKSGSNDDKNNALYEPRASYSVIYVGDGDGQILQNLALDSDVVSHELGHHIVYSTVKTIANESLVVHEGLADYFTFARSGNACLGESICPESSVQTRVCAIPKQCLRTAENEYTFTSKNLPLEPHLKSQFISGMLWDLTARDGLASADVVRLVLKAIELLVSNSGYQHLVVALLLADDALFESSNCTTILDRALTRGLASKLQGISCDAIEKQTTITATSTGSVDDYLGGGSPTSTESRTQKSGSKHCGVISGVSSSGQDMSLLLLWFLPLFISLLRRFRR